MTGIAVDTIAEAGDAAVTRVIDLLIAGGNCDQKAIERARRVTAETEQRLDTVLIRLGIVAERALAEAYAASLGFALVAADGYPAGEPLFPERLSAKFLRNVRALPLRIEKGTLVIAVADPLDRFISASISAATGLPVSIEIATPIELESAFDRLYPEAGSDTADVREDPESGAADPLDEDAERLKDMASEAPVIRLVNQIIARAVESQASDIHIEPFVDHLRVRYRHDGVLSEADSPPGRLMAAITSRIKIMARLDIAERRLPQDGRIKMAVRGHEIDFRVSTIPSLYGETVVLRVLDRSAVAFDYARLGLPQGVIAQLNEALDLPNGIVLVTGPTGSGKTTTLYTGLLGLNSAARKIVTVEDPIEYQLRGVNQIQVKPQIGLTFAGLLRSILRQDPDVIMVGEIRDLETAQIAVQAALTGHLVLSTLHTNSASATITRLRDMGVEDYLLTAVLRGVLAQRLVRRLCVQCRREEEATPALSRRFDLDRRCNGMPVRLWHATGCPHCRGTGYHGRLAIAEFLRPNAEVEKAIFAGAGHTQIERLAVEAGMVTLFDAGLDAVLAGATSLEELTRSIRSEA
ncbi:MAG TPA: ATPase, T2SS/T4P/T4SS family [Rhodopila sp.]|nr:ATPase, T2SS/T4P/T4SS family [Rhodopila sp.]